MSAPPIRTVCMFPDCLAVLVDVPEDARGLSHGLCVFHEEHYDEACALLAELRREALDAGEPID